MNFTLLYIVTLESDASRGQADSYNEEAVRGRVIAEWRPPWSNAASIAPMTLVTLESDAPCSQVTAPMAGWNLRQVCEFITMAALPTGGQQSILAAILDAQLAGDRPTRWLRCNSPAYSNPTACIAGALTARARLYAIILYNSHHI